MEARNVTEGEINMSVIVRAFTILILLMFVQACWPGSFELHAEQITSKSIQLRVTLPQDQASKKVTGRVVVVFSRKPEPEPREQIHIGGPQIVGIDIEQRDSGSIVDIPLDAIAYPLHNLSKLRTGRYYVQAVFNVYTEFRRSDGHQVWLPKRAEGRFFQTSPGNYYSDVKMISIGENDEVSIHLSLTEKIPSLHPFEDTEWLKHVKIESTLLSDFWGQPMHLEARVLLPKGYSSHPQVAYPVVYLHGHLRKPFYFNSDPRTVGTEEGLRAAGLQPGYEFFQSWISDDFPRVIGVSLIQATPFFPDSHSVNSANSGPYGDALMTELIPFIEREFRIIREPYARIVEGASTGGWSALSQQLRHPDFFGGAWVFNPDPIDFRRYQLVNIYEDDNAFFSATSQQGMQQPRPYLRTVEGQVLHTVQEVSRFESVLGTRGRSGYQLNAWNAYYGPVGPDGYPDELWDKTSGKIDKDIATYMRQSGYDLVHYAGRNWETIGPLVGDKLHIITGDMDNYYLSPAVYLFEDLLTEKNFPQATGMFVYGRPKKGHSWHPYNFAQMVRQMSKHIIGNAPVGANTEMWQY